MSDQQRYQVIEPIAAGGMAEVYRGESAGIEGFRKKVAIKRVLPKLSANSEFINMFLDEARLCAYLNHSRCVQVFDIGQGAGAHFIVMEFVDGADLKGVLDYLSEKKQVMPVEVACQIALEVCEGLAYAHDAVDHAGEPLNIVHRDISPHNVLMTRFGEVKLVDFGLAKASSHLTDEEEDMVKGKFGYLAPEVCLGQGADRRVDIFAAGILLWEMLAGRRLFLGDSDVETFKLVRAAEIPDVRQFRKDVSDDLMKVLGKALARDRDQRYQRAGDVASDLSVVLMRSGRPVTYQQVAKLVSDAANERDKRKKAERKDTTGFIGDLMLDALHDFSGGMEDFLDERESRLGTAGVQADGGDFEDPTDWGLNDIFDEPAKQAPPPAPEPSGDPMADAIEAAAAATTGDATAKPKPPAAAKPREQPPPPPKRAATEGEKAQPPPPPRRGKRPSPENEQEGPFWRRWFGS